MPNSIQHPELTGPLVIALEALGVFLSRENARQTQGGSEMPHATADVPGNLDMPDWYVTPDLLKTAFLNPDQLTGDEKRSLQKALTYLSDPEVQARFGRPIVLQAFKNLGLIREPGDELRELRHVVSRFGSALGFLASDSTRTDPDPQDVDAWLARLWQGNSLLGAQRAWNYFRDNLENLIDTRCFKEAHLQEVFRHLQSPHRMEREIARAFLATHTKVLTQADFPDDDTSVVAETTGQAHGVGQENGALGQEFDLGALTREEIDDIVSRDDFETTQLVNKLKQIPSLKDFWNVVVGEFEKDLTLEKHVLLVMQQFERYFGHVEFCEMFTKGFFRLFLALHDIGKPKAILEENRRKQHEYNETLLCQVLQALGYSEQQINFVRTLLNDKFGAFFIRGVRAMGKMLQYLEDRDELGPDGRTTDDRGIIKDRLAHYDRYIRRALSFTEEQAEEALAQIYEQRSGLLLESHLREVTAKRLLQSASRAHMSADRFLQFCIMYHQVDAGAYTTDAEGAFQMEENRSAFDDVFVFDRNRGIMGYTEPMASAVQRLRKDLQLEIVERAPETPRSKAAAPVPRRVPDRLPVSEPSRVQARRSSQEPGTGEVDSAINLISSETHLEMSRVVRRPSWALAHPLGMNDAPMSAYNGSAALEIAAGVLTETEPEPLLGIHTLTSSQVTPEKKNVRLLRDQSDARSQTLLMRFHSRKSRKRDLYQLMKQRGMHHLARRYKDKETTQRHYVSRTTKAQLRRALISGSRMEVRRLVNQMSGLGTTTPMRAGVKTFLNAKVIAARPLSISIMKTVSVFAI